MKKAGRTSGIKSELEYITDFSGGTLRNNALIVLTTYVEIILENFFSLEVIKYVAIKPAFLQRDIPKDDVTMHNFSLLFWFLKLFRKHASPPLKPCE